MAGWLDAGWLMPGSCEMGGGRCIRLFALSIMLPVLRCGEGGLAPIFLPFLNWKIKMHDVSPGASVQWPTNELSNKENCSI